MLGVGGGRRARSRVATLENPATHVYTRQIATTYDPKWGGAATKTLTGGARDCREFYTYDPEWGDLMAVETYAIGATRPMRTESWTYDGQGRVVSKTSPEGRLTYGYDSQGRLNRIGRGDGRQTRYEYDKQGNLVRVIDRAMGLDPAKDSAVVYTYDRHGRKRVVQYPNGARATWQYADATGGGWFSEVAHYGRTESNATIQLLKLVYTRDASGLILKIAETGPNHAQTWVYSHDGLKRLTSANRFAGYFPGATAPTGSPAAAYSYLYDRNGNRTSMTVDGVTTTYQYNSLDQLVSEYRGATQTKSYTWDNGGRMATETNLETASLSRVYTWTADDRLVAVRLGSASDELDDPVIHYAYDYLGTRVSRSALDSGDDSDPDETRYLVDYKNLTGYSQTLAEVGEDDAPLREYVYGQEHGALAQTTPGSAADIFHADHLGTTGQLTDAAGRARLTAGPAGYSPFGEATSGNLGSLTSLAFTGQFREAGKRKRLGNKFVARASALGTKLGLRQGHRESGSWDFTSKGARNAEQGGGAATSAASQCRSLQSP